MIELAAEGENDDEKDKYYKLLVKPDLGPNYDPAVFHVKLLQHHLRTLLGEAKNRKSTFALYIGTQLEILKLFGHLGQAVKLGFLDIH